MDASQLVSFSSGGSTLEMSHPCKEGQEGGEHQLSPIELAASKLGVTGSISVCEGNNG